MYERDKALKKFYDSRRWRTVRDLIRSKYHGSCQQCGGVGEEVHHIIPLTIENMNSDLAVSEDNLVLLCTNCHNSQRIDEVRGDIMFDCNGDVILK